ncbi:MAG: Ig-like domain-containing protein [Bifidobacterium crudilactis]|jgi:uncharacterized surface anchored protein|nr:Ig-like domain-containing protein [Bifidobacterium crudilactis]MDN6804981.1 Ig-like domain-containing protein [Bifidobacterium crudilactis]MDN6853162.1 Ig-like domain-containing protein [Bifidobacterium crudilactis]
MIRLNSDVGVRAKELSPFFRSGDSESDVNEKGSLFRRIFLVVTSLLCLLAMTLSGAVADAAEITGVLNNFSVTGTNGNSSPNVGRWNDFRINGDFDLSGKDVKSGDTTTIKLPDQLTLEATSAFDLKSSDGSVVASVTVDASTKTLIITYAPYVDTHSDVKGSFFFYTRVDSTVVKEATSVPINLTIDGKVVHAGDVNYTGPDKPNYAPIGKSGWFNNDGTLTYSIYVNRDGAARTDASVSDRLQFDGGSIVPGSIQVTKGRWVWNDNTSGWGFSDVTDVTSSYTSTIDADGKGMNVKLGDYAASDGFKISYSVKLSYTPVDGEVFANKAELLSHETVIKDTTTNVRYTVSGGQGEGSVFTIRIHKTDEGNSPLAGAVFSVTRDATGAEVGKITTDANGNGELHGVLKTSYTLIETVAPDGYQLDATPIKVVAGDFTSDHAVTKTVVNKRIPEVVGVAGVKSWNDDGNRDGLRPDHVVVNVLANGVKVESKRVSAADGWRYAFENLPKFDGGKLIQYTVSEDAVDGYTATVEGFDITNTHTPGKVVVPGNNPPAKSNGGTLAKTGAQVYAAIGAMLALAVAGAGILLSSRKRSKR